MLYVHGREKLGFISGFPPLEQRLDWGEWLAVLPWWCLLQWLNALS